MRSVLGLATASAKRRPYRKARPEFGKLLLEPLEDRVVPATVTWIKAAGGDWDTGSNWSTGTVPNSGDAVVINAVSSPVTHAQAIADTVGSITTTGNVTLSGGSLTAINGISVSGGATFLLAGGTLANTTIGAGSKVTLSNLGGTLTQDTVAFGGFIDGTRTVAPGTGAAFNLASVTGGLTLNGEVDLGATNGGAAGQLFFDLSQNLIAGTGRVVFGTAANTTVGNTFTGNALYARGINSNGTGPATLIVGNTITVQGGDGLIGGFFATDSVVNNGFVQATNTGTMLLQGGAVTNFGTFQVDAGASLLVGPNTNLTNLDNGDGTFTFGKYFIAGRFDIPGTITTNAAFIQVTGPGGKMTAGGGDALGRMNENTGTLILKGATVNTVTFNPPPVPAPPPPPPPFMNAGALVIDGTNGPANFGSVNGFQQIELSPSRIGTTTLIGGGMLTAPAVTLAAGSLSGDGTVVGNLTNAAVVSPGFTIPIPAPGVITVNGKYTQTTGGELDLKIAGFGTPGAAYDQVVSTGNATLGGTISVSLVGGFTPSLGQAFTVMNFAYSDGDFTVKKGLAVGMALALDEFYTKAALSLRVDPTTGTSLGASTPSITYDNITPPFQDSVPVTLFVTNPFGTVSGGLVSIVLTDQAGNVVTTASSGPVSGNSATATLFINRGQHGGVYYVNASYSGVTGSFLPSTAVSTFTISQAPTAVSVTSKASTPFGLADQTVTLTAAVSSPNGAVTDGTVKFTVFNLAGVQIGQGASGTVFAGPTGSSASATFVVPANTPVGMYTVVASYDDGPGGNFAPSSSTPSTSGTLTVVPGGATVTAALPALVPTSPTSQTVALGAQVTNLGVGVPEGTVTFTVFVGSGTAGPVLGTPVTVPVVNGSANANYLIPANTPVGTYTIQAKYADSTGLFLASSDTATLTVQASVDTFINPAGGDWDTGSNWSSGKVPTAGQFAKIPSLAGPVTHASSLNDTVLGIAADSPIILSGGSLTVNGQLTVGSGAAFVLSGGLLANAELAGPTRLVLTDQGGILTGLTIDAEAVIDGTGLVPGGDGGRAYNFATVAGGITLNGTIDLGAANGASAAQLFFNKTQNIVSGTGTIQFGTAPNGPNGNALLAQGQNSNGTEPASLIIGEAFGDSISVVGGNGRIAGVFGTDSVVNNSIIEAAGTGTILFQGGILSNQGTLKVDAGATMEITPDTNVTNYNAGLRALVNGTFDIEGTFMTPVPIFVNEAEIILKGPAARAVLTGNPSVNALATLTANADSLTVSDTTLTLNGGFPLGFFQNTGIVTVSGTTGVLNIQGDYVAQVFVHFGEAETTLSGGGTLKAGTVQLISFDTMSPSILDGSGTIVGNLVSMGIVSPGDLFSTGGIINVTGNYTQNANLSAYVPIIGGTTPGTYSQLNVSGLVSLAGTIDVEVAPGFTPALGDSYVTITFAGSSGDWLNKNGLSASAAITLDEFFTAGALTLRADPEFGTSLGIVPTPTTVAEGSGAVINFTVYMFNPLVPFKGAPSVGLVLVNQAGTVVAAATSGGFTQGTIAPTNSTANQAMGDIVLPDNLPAGKYLLEANWPGVPGFLLPSTATATINVLGKTVVATQGVVIPVSTAAQTITLTANVTSPDGTVNEGSVTFSVTANGTVPVTAPVVNGVATVTYTIPGGTPIGNYPIVVQYADANGGFASSQDNTQVVSVRNAVAAAGTNNVSTPFSESAQNVKFSATLTSPGGVVGEGAVTFTLVDKNGNPVGNPVTSGTVAKGAVSATFSLPAATVVGTYTVMATYSDPTGKLFANSPTAVVGTVTVTQAATTVVPTRVVIDYNAAARAVTVSAAVTSTGGEVDEGQVTFSLFDAGNNLVGTAVAGVQTLGGMATTIYSLPAGAAIGTYALEADYADGPLGGFAAGSGTTTFIIQRAQTTTTAANLSALAFSESDRSLSVSATVTSAAVPAINEGSVTFVLLNALGVAIDAPVTVAVSGGKAGASVDLPAGTPQGSYTLQAKYDDGAGTLFVGSQDTSHVLVVQSAATVTTTPTVVATFNAAAQTVTFTVSVTSAAGPVSEGAVAIGLFDSGNRPVGGQTSAGTVTNGTATVTYALPAGTPVAAYAIHVTYTDPTPGAFLTSSDNTHVLNVEYATTTAAASTGATFSTTAQNVTLTATLSSAAGAVTEGKVTFTVFDATHKQIGTATTGTVSGGTATATYVLPGNTPAGPYTIVAAYADANTTFEASTDSSQTLTVNPATTSVTAAPALVTFSQSALPITFTATVLSPAGAVNEGTVTFTVFSGTTVVGTAVTSGVVANGKASAQYVLPGGSGAGTYQVVASYSDVGANFQSADNAAGPAQLTVAQAASATSADSISVAAPTFQPVILSATITSPSGQVNEGTVTFQLLNGSTPVGGPVTSGRIALGVAKATYSLPAGTPPGIYTIRATYNPGPDLLNSPSSDGTLTLDVSPQFVSPLGSSNAITLPHNQFPFVAPDVAASPIGLSVQYSTAVVGVNPAFDLQKQYQFTGVNYFDVGGAAAYVLKSSVVNKFNSPYYLIRPADGAVFAYDNSGSYASSYMASAPLATLGANAYADPAILLHPTAPVDYTTLFNLEQQFKFQGVGTFSPDATAYVFKSLAGNNGFGNAFYLLRADGELFAYDGSGSYAHTFSHVTPTAKLDPNVYLNPSALINAVAAPALYSQLYALQAQYDLQFNGSFMTNLYGHQAQWVYSPVLNQFGQHWYTLILDSGGTTATLRAWQGYADSAVGATIATLDASVYFNPALLTTATNLPAPAVNASVDASGNLSVALANSSYVGAFRVVVTATDGFLSTSQSVMVTSTDTAPALTIANGGTPVGPTDNQVVSHQGFPLTDTVATTDAEGDAVTTTASVSTASLPFALQQRYQFTGVGYFTAGATAYVLRAAGNNSFGNQFYLLKSDGGLYAYDDSKSYSHTFANVAPIAVLGSNFFADPTLLTAAQPAVDYTLLYNLQKQFQFSGFGVVTAGATAYVLQSSQAGPGVKGFYLVRPDGALFAYDGSGSYAHTFANSTPLALLDPEVFRNPGLLINAQATPDQYAALQQAEQRFDLQVPAAGFATGKGGNAAKWLFSPIPNVFGQNYYSLVLSADGTQALLYAWDGGAKSVPTGTTPVATFDAGVYFNPFLLLTAKAPIAAIGATATISGGTLSISAPPGFVGTFQVTVTATDGGLTTAETFRVTSADTPPVPNAVPAQTVSVGTPLHLTLGSTDAQNDAVTYSATAVGYNPAFNLQQVYQFKGVGYDTKGGVMAYKLTSNVLNTTASTYLIKSDGGVYAYDGAASYATTFANSANRIATLDPSVFTNPTLLTNASAPGFLVTLPGPLLSVSGNTATIDASGLSVGTVFQVVVTASDGAETAKTGFLVTVTA